MARHAKTEPDTGPAPVWLRPDETCDIVGTFGRVGIMPRDPEMGHGTLIHIDTSARFDGHPVVVMVNNHIVEEEV